MPAWIDLSSSWRICRGCSPGSSVPVVTGMPGYPGDPAAVRNAAGFLTGGLPGHVVS